MQTEERRHHGPSLRDKYGNNAVVTTAAMLLLLLRLKSCDVLAHHNRADH
jgi:hypothetical protein